MEHAEVNYLEIEENIELEEKIKSVVEECFKVEKLDQQNLYVNIVLTNPKNIQEINKVTRGIDKATDVLSFPMFEKDEISKLDVNNNNERVDILGDIVISVERVKEQAAEYGHSFKRELSYMVVHGFYHLLGYDHMNEDDKSKMRKKEESVLNRLNIMK